MNHLFPAFFKLEDLKILIIGGGNVGLEKATAVLVNSPLTHLKIVATYFHPDMDKMINQYPNVVLHKREYLESDLEGINILIGATDNRDLHVRIREQAHKRNILVNIADTPPLCDFYLGSVVRKGDLKIAISTNGKSPTLAKRIRENFEEIFPDEMQSVLDNMEAIRHKLKGDFAEKIIKLNQITTAMKAKGSKDKPNFKSFFKKLFH